MYKYKMNENNRLEEIPGVSFAGKTKFFNNFFCDENFLENLSKNDCFKDNVYYKKISDSVCYIGIHAFWCSEYNHDVKSHFVACFNDQTLTVVTKKQLNDYSLQDFFKISFLCKNTVLSLFCMDRYYLRGDRGFLNCFHDFCNVPNFESNDDVIKQLDNFTIYYRHKDFIEDSSIDIDTKKNAVFDLFKSSRISDGYSIRLVYDHINQKLSYAYIDTLLEKYQKQELLKVINSWRD